MRKILYTIILYTLLATHQQTTAEKGDGLIGKPAPDWGKLRWINSDPLQLNNLANKVRGYESSKFGRMSIDELKALYNRKPAHITEPSILIRINKFIVPGTSKENLIIKIH